MSYNSKVFIDRCTSVYIINKKIASPLFRGAVTHNSLASFLSPATDIFSIIKIHSNIQQIYKCLFHDKILLTSTDFPCYMPAEEIVNAGSWKVFRSHTPVPYRYPANLNTSLMFYSELPGPQRSSRRCSTRQQSEQTSCVCAEWNC